MCRENLECFFNQLLILFTKVRTRFSPSRFLCFGSARRTQFSHLSRAKVSSAQVARAAREPCDGGGGGRHTNCERCCNCYCCTSELYKWRSAFLTAAGPPLSKVTNKIRVVQIFVLRPLCSLILLAMGHLISLKYESQNTNLFRLELFCYSI